MTIPRSTRALLDLCPEPAPGPAGNPAEALDIASFHGAVALRLGCAYVHDHWAACEQAREAGVKLVSHADLLPAGSYRRIFLDARELDPALAADFIAQAAQRLEPGGVLYTTARRADVEAWFDQVEEQGEALIARSPQVDGAPGGPGPEQAAPGEPAPGWLTYQVTVGDQSLTMQSVPGIFSPRGLDPGTREMLTVIPAQPGQRFLDLGCGAGVVSLVAARLWGCQVTAVDVSARALRVTRHNVPEAEVVASDGFAALPGRRFDLIASNPPYHTDYAVARGFIEGAHRHLTPGGWLYLVVKRADWYIQKVRAVFGGCRVVEREGYAILAAEKRAAVPKPARAQEPKTTKKHAKRMAGSRRR